MNPATNPLAAAGAGRERRPWGIREHLDRLGLSMEDVARDLGVSGQLVRATVRGRANNTKVLRKLQALGVPATDLALPERLKRELSGRAA